MALNGNINSTTKDTIVYTKDTNQLTTTNDICGIDRITPFQGLGRLGDIIS